jgi:hypothetical protein
VQPSGNNRPGRQVPILPMRIAAAAALLTAPASALASPLNDAVSAGDPVASVITGAGAILAIAGLAVLGGRRQKAPVPVPVRRRPATRRRR